MTWPGSGSVAALAIVVVACSSDAEQSSTASDGATGGTSASGAGGTTSSGGAAVTGGTTSSGGTAPTGGAVATGGATSSGGASGGGAGLAGAGGAAGATDCLGDAATSAPSNCADLVYYAVDCGDGARPLASERCDYLKVHARRQVFEAVFGCLSTLDLELPFCEAEHDAAVGACEAAALAAACPTLPAADADCPSADACPGLTLDECRSVLQSLNETTRQAVVDCYAGALPAQVDPSLACDAKFRECARNIDAYL